MLPVPAYTALDMLRSMQREMYEDTWGPISPDNGELQPGRRHADRPDPIGMAAMRLRPGERLHGLIGRLSAGRDVRARRRRERVTDGRVTDSRLP